MFKNKLLVTGILFIFLSNAQGLFAQNSQASNWVFGRGAGLKFNPTNTIALETSPFSSFENCASVSSQNGTFLFSTNGNRVYNRSFVEMPNGKGLNGSENNTQGVAILQNPSNPFKYYIFTVNATTGLFYSEVDMNLNSGLGDVVTSSKNTAVYSGPLAEKVVIAKHCTLNEYWVIVHGRTNNQFNVFRVTGSSVSNFPVVSSLGSSHSTGKGYMKVSPNNKKLAVVQSIAAAGNAIELFSFDNSTGLITAPLPLQSSGGEYGASFSPNSSRLFVSSSKDSAGGKVNSISQFDLLSTNISGSKSVVIRRFNPVPGAFGALQLGNDKKIYVAQQFIDRVHVINNPNESASNAGFVDSAIFTPNATGRLGLPNLIDDWFKDSLKADFKYDLSCKSSPFQFRDSSFTNVQTWNWDFGDINSPNNTAFNATPTHLFTDTGYFNVKLIVSDGCGSIASVEKFIYVTSRLPIDFEQPDTVGLCAGLFVKLVANSVNNATYQWQNGSPNNWVNFTNPGSDYTVITQSWYRVVVTLLNGCSGSDSAYVSFNAAPPVVDLGKDIQYTCGKTPIVLNSGFPNLPNSWSTGDSTHIIYALQSGNYVVSVSDKGCIVKDSVKVIREGFETLDLGPDRGWCEGKIEVLDATGTGDKYFWSDFSPFESISVTDTGTYSVVVTSNNGCIQKDTVTLFYNCPFRLFIPSAFTPDDDNLNDIFKPSIDATDFYTFQVFDRLGREMFKTSDPKEGWNGKEGSTLLPESTYTYLITYKEAGKLRLKRKSGLVWLTY